jgi:hypothetical protein
MQLPLALAVAVPGTFERFPKPNYDFLRFVSSMVSTSGVRVATNGQRELEDRPVRRVWL